MIKQKLQEIYDRFMKKIKEVFLGQLSDTVNKRVSDSLLNKRQQKEIIEESVTEEEILAQQQQQLEKDNKDQEDKSTDKSISNTLSAKEKANLIVGP